jgi:hypothetical protein
MEIVDPEIIVCAAIAAGVVVAIILDRVVNYKNRP